MTRNSEISDYKHNQLSILTFIFGYDKGYKYSVFVLDCSAFY